MQGEQLIRYSVFIAAVLAVLGVIGVLLGSLDFLLQNILLLVFLAVLGIVFWKTDVLLRLREYERAVIMRLGKVTRVGGPGWAIVLPFIEEPHLVDLRTQAVDIPKQEVINKDTVKLVVDTVLYIKVRDDKQSVINSIVEVKDYKEAIVLFVSARMRDIVGSMNLETIITSVERINAELAKEAEKFSENWGIAIERIEIQEIQLPESIQKAIHEQQAAVQERLARIERAEAQKAEIEAVNKATETLSDKALTYYYIKALEEMSRGKSTKLVFPMEVSRLAESVSSRINPSPETSMEMLESLLKRATAKKP